MKISVLLSCFILISACSPYKPPLTDTQVLNGNSIVLPPDFDNLPKEK